MLDFTNKLTRAELAWEFASVFDELDVDQINEVLAKNVPMETLEFFASYAQDLARAQGVSRETERSLPNLLLLGYLLRVLEDRLIGEVEPLDG